MFSKPSTSSYCRSGVHSDSSSDTSDTGQDRVIGKKTSSKSPGGTKAAKRKFIHKYRKEWEQIEEFKGWLGSSKKGNEYFNCKICSDDNKGGLSAVKKHSKTDKHVKNSQSIKSSRDLKEVFSKPNKLENQAKEGEIRIAAFIAEHNISFNTADHLMELIKSVCNDSEIAKKMSCDHTKCTALINNAIGKSNFEELILKMKTNKFSILVDESTDKTDEKHLAVVVRTCLNNLDVRDEFLCMLDVVDGTSNGLYTLLIDFFNKHEIPYKSNMIGFAADGTNTMMGAHNSLQALIKRDIPNVFIMKCICHSLALCASYACEKLPSGLEDLVRSIYSYFKYSSKRQIEFKAFQSFVEVKPHKLIKPCQTRWLSLEACIRRLLEQWPALYLFFQGEALSSDVQECARNIFEKMTPLNKLYLEFLNHVLPILTDLNLEFQSEKPKVHYLYSRIESAYRTILDCYLEPKYLKSKDVSEIQYRNPANFINIEKMYLGAKCHSSIMDNSKSGTPFPTEDLDRFRVHCLNFYVECAKQMFTRFPFNSSYMQSLKTLQFLDPSKKEEIQSISHTVSAFESISDINAVELDREWRVLRNTDIVMGEDKSTLSYWRKVQNCKKGNNEDMFPVLIRFVAFIFTLPHSSATVERIFSAVNLNKTKTRNRLGSKSLSGILRTKNVLQKTQSSCFNFEITKDLIKKHNNKIYEN
jgi:hypothetical protein